MIRFSILSCLVLLTLLSWRAAGQDENQNFFLSCFVLLTFLSWRAAGQDKNRNLVLSFRTGQPCPVLISGANLPYFAVLEVLCSPLASISPFFSLQII